MDQTVKKIDIGDIFRKSWEHYKRNWKVLTMLMVGGAIVSVIGSFLLRESWFLSQVWTLIYSALFGFAVLNVSLSAVRGRAVLGDALQKLSIFWKYALVSFLLGLLVTIGFFMLIIPGIILVVSLWWAVYLVVDDGKGVIEALYASADVTRGVRWSILGVGVIVGLLHSLALPTFGFSLFITGPFAAVVMAEVYVRLIDMSRSSRVSVIGA